jgi:hypothetical protein
MFAYRYDWVSDWSTLGPEERAKLREQVEMELSAWRANLQDLTEREVAVHIEHYDAPRGSQAALRAGYPLYLRRGHVKNNIERLEKQLIYLTPPAELNDVPALEASQDNDETMKPVPGGPTKKQLFSIAESLLKGKLEAKKRLYILAFKYRETPNLPWDRAYKDLPGTDKLSKVSATRERNFYLWAEKGEDICRTHFSQ